MTAADLGRPSGGSGSPGSSGPAGRAGAVGLAARRWRPLRVVERNAVIARHYWPALVGRVVEPFLYLFSIGLGVGALVDGVTGPAGTPVSYRSFVAPAMLATSAMATAVFATSIDFYAKFRWIKSFEAMLATPLGARDVIRGELLWALGLVTVQSVSFTAAMVAFGLIGSWWGLALVPAALLVGWAFGCAGFVASSYLRTWLDFDYIMLATMPMFLFSASFFPLDRYPDPVARVVQLTPMYHGVELARSLAFGTVGWADLVAVLYLTLLGRACLAWADHRLDRMLRP